LLANAAQENRKFGRLLGAGHRPQGWGCTSTPPAASPAVPTAPARPVLTTPSVTHHTIVIPGGNIAFTAAVETVILNGANAQPQAESVTTAFLRDTAEAESRPVTFVFNGGPGTGSAWLDLGAIGPWRMKMNQDAAQPSADITPVDNAETWLDFTDLVFIDPPGTGYARLLVEGEEARKHFWSVNGDIDAIAETIRRWLANHHRMASSKYVVGESYGGFRGPRVVRTLAMEQGVGVRGLVLISPLLDFGTSAVFDPLSWVWALPSEVAAVRARKRPVSRADLADVEEYALQRTLGEQVTVKKNLGEAIARGGIRTIDAARRRADRWIGEATNRARVSARTGADQDWRGDTFGRGAHRLVAHDDRYHAVRAACDGRGRTGLVFV
jgi:carboxypeptidase C (cathepsin A)